MVKPQRISDLLNVRCMTDIHDRIRQAREAKFSTAKEAAEALGVGYPNYAAHENGTRSPSHPAIAQYARRFGVTTDWLITGKNLGFGESAVQSAIRAIFEVTPRDVLTKIEPDAMADLVIVCCRSMADHPATAPETIVQVVNLAAERLRRAS